jgi:hypothetical protein
MLLQEVRRISPWDRARSSYCTRKCSYEVGEEWKSFRERSCWTKICHAKYLLPCAMPERLRN